MILAMKKTGIGRSGWAIRILRQASFAMSKNCEAETTPVAECDPDDILFRRARHSRKSRLLSTRRNAVAKASPRTREYTIWDHEVGSLVSESDHRDTNVSLYCWPQAGSKITLGRVALDAEAAHRRRASVYRMQMRRVRLFSLRWQTMPKPVPSWTITPCYPGLPSVKGSAVECRSAPDLACCGH